MARRLSPVGTGKRGTPLIVGGAQLTPATLRRLDIGLVRKEYTRVRDIARKRIERLNEAGLLTPRQYSNMQTMIPRIRGLSNEGDVFTALVGAYRFLDSEVSTITGRRRQRLVSIQNLQLMGVSNATEENADLLFRFIDEQASLQVDGGKIGSPTVIAFLAETQTREKTMEGLRREFNEWISNPENIF